MAVGTWSDPYGAQGGGLPSVGDISMFSSKPTGGSGMFGAILGGGLSLAGSIFGARSQASAAQAQMNAAADQLKNNIMMNREARKGNLAKFIGQNVADLTALNMGAMAAQNRVLETNPTKQRIAGKYFR